MKRKIIWTKPPWLWVPAVSFRGRIWFEAAVYGIKLSIKTSCGIDNSNRVSCHSKMTHEHLSLTQPGASKTEGWNLAWKQQMLHCSCHIITTSWNNEVWQRAPILVNHNCKYPVTPVNYEAKDKMDHICIQLIRHPPEKQIVMSEASWLCSKLF